MALYGILHIPTGLWLHESFSLNALIEEKVSYFSIVTARVKFGYRHYKIVGTLEYVNAVLTYALGPCSTIRIGDKSNLIPVNAIKEEFEIVMLSE